jgi:hypothetical protein
MGKQIGWISAIVISNIVIIFIVLFFLGFRVRVSSVVSQVLRGKTHDYITSEQNKRLDPVPPIQQVTWPLDQQRFVGVIVDSGLGNKMFSIATAYGFAIRNGLAPPLVFYQNSSNKSKYTEWGGHDIGAPTYDYPEVPRRLKDVFPYIRFADVTEADKVPGMFAGSAIFGEIGEEDYLTPLPVIDTNQYNMPEAFIFRGLWFAPVQFLRERDVILNKVFVFHPSIERYIDVHYESILRSYHYTAVHLRLGHMGDTFEMPFPSANDIQKFVRNAGVEKFIVFTDNIDRAKKLLNQMEQGFQYVFITDLPFIEMACMKRLKRFLISRSTFSWWGAFLMNGKDATIAVCRDVKMSKMVSMHHCFQSMMTEESGWTPV